MGKEAIRRDDVDHVPFFIHFVDSAMANICTYKFENIKLLFELVNSTAKNICQGVRQCVQNGDPILGLKIREVVYEMPAYQRRI